MMDLNSYSEIIIWGASLSPNEVGEDATTHGHAIEKLYKLLEEKGAIKKLKCFVDSNQKIQGKITYGKEIKAPIELLNYPNALIIINSLSIQAIYNTIVKLKINNDCVVIPYYFYHGILGKPYDLIRAKEHIIKYKEQIKDLFNTEDEVTKRYLDIIFELREKGKDTLYPLSFYKGTGENCAYFCDPNLAPKSDITFIDIGAYQGESIEPIRQYYKEQFKKCIAFEPSKQAYQKLETYIKEKYLEDKVIVLPYALGKEEKTLSFNESGATSYVVENGIIKVEQKIFDNLPNLNIIGEPMIKMDIEGAELEALQGMKQFIKQYKPYLAICLYHKETDLYDLPHYIKSLYSDYQLFLRGGWHLECWAIPKRHFERR